MPDSTMPSAPPSFEKAEFNESPINESPVNDPLSAEHCRLCREPVGANYYRIRGAMVCVRCAARAKAKSPADTHAAFMRALLFGSGGALAGLALYATVEIATGLIIGYVALAVGYMVGWSMNKGSGGVGGRRYQIAAALLTYFAVSMAAIPVTIAQIRKESPRRNPAITTPSGKTSDGVTGTAGSDSQSIPQQGPPGGRATDDAAPAPAPKDTQARQTSQTSFGKAATILLLFGVASPFLALASPVSGAIGLFILAIGIRFAWQQTASRRSMVDGPFAAAAK